MQLKIKNQEIKLQWGLTAIIRYCESIGMDDDMDKAIDLAMPADLSAGNLLRTVKHLAKFVYAAAQDWAEDNDAAVDFTERDVIKEINEKGYDFITEIIKDFTASTFMGQSLTAIVSEPSDKKEGQAPKKSRAAKS
jgi:hypothetical protein